MSVFPHDGLDAVPSDKSPEMTEALDNITHALFGRERSDSINNSKCVTCGGDALHFKDRLSAKEYGISGMCQSCQDSVFG